MPNDLPNKPQAPLPEAEKRAVLQEHAERFDVPVFIETGTYMGGTAMAMSRLFEEVHTIELSMALFRQTKTKLKHLDNVVMYMGDSAVMLEEVLSHTDRRCLVWLDAHYSGGKTAYREKKTPIIAELEALAYHERNDHVILIDDIRAFIENPAYPSIDELAVRLGDINPDYTITIVNDIMRALPPEENDDV